MCTYGRGLKRLLAHTYGEGSLTWLGRNGETTSSSCSWGANWLGRNWMCRHVHREGLDGTGDGNEAWRTIERRKRPCVRLATFEMGSCSSGGVWHTAKQRKRTSYVRNGVLLIERGVAYRKMEETNLLRSNGSHVDREWCGVPQKGRNGPPTVETGVLLIGRGVAYRKTGLHGILFISTVDLLQPPRATVDLLQPPRAPVHPASTARYSTGYCSTTPPPSTVHPALHTTGSCSSRGNATAHCSSKPPRNAHCSSNQSASVSYSNEGIARSGSVNSHRSLAWVQ